MKIPNSGKKQTYDEGKLLDLLEREPLLISVAVAAMDAQLRAIKRCDDVPLFVYNFIPNQKDLQAVEGVIRAFRAVTFSNAVAGAIEVTLRDASDLNMWRNCQDRVVVLKTASGSLLRPLIEELAERDRVEKCGGNLPPPLPTVPIAVSRNVLHCPHVDDIELGNELWVLTDDEMDILRWAMTQVLAKKIAETAKKRWDEMMSKPQSYRWERGAVWRSVLMQLLIECWFRDQENRARARALFSTEEERQQEEEQKRCERIASAVALISTPARYQREIIERPMTKVDAEKALADEAVAFWYTPAKGIDAGGKLVVFSKKSLLRLLRRVSVDEALYDAVLDACESSGVLHRRNQTINLGGSSFCGVTISLPK